MTRIRDLHKKWMKDPAYRKEYEALGDEFALAEAVAEARVRAGLSQAQLARRMRTTQIQPPAAARIGLPRHCPQRGDAAPAFAILRTCSSSWNGFQACSAEQMDSPRGCQ
jgi:hypothetical protein